MRCGYLYRTEQVLEYKRCVWVNVCVCFVREKKEYIIVCGRMVLNRKCTLGIDPLDYYYVYVCLRERSD